MRIRPPRWWHALTLAQRALVGACVLLGLVCAWLILPAATAAPAGPAATQPLPPVPRITDSPGPSAPEYEVLVERNLFARSRSAPDEPWRPPTETGAQPARSMGPVAPTPPDVSSYRLFGTVVAGRLEESFAIIEADPETPGPELYNVGDRVGPYRLTSIYYSRVVLTGEGATRELRLVPDSLPGAGQASTRGRPQ